MRLSLVLLLGLLAAVFSQDLSPAPLATVVFQYISLEAHSRSAGSLPLRLVAKFVPSFDLIANQHTIIINQEQVSALICSGQITEKWTIFIASVNLRFQNASQVIPGIFGENRDEDLEDIRFVTAWDFNVISTNPVSALGAIAPRGRGIVSAEGKTLFVTLETPNGVLIGVQTVSTGEYHLKAGVQYEMFIPQRFLSPNLEFPKQTVFSSMGVALTRSLPFPLPFAISLLDFVEPGIPAVVPMTYNVPELGIRTLLLMSAVPSTTVSGQQLQWLRLTFELGILVSSGGYLGIEADQNIFADVPSSGSFDNYLVSVGYNCAAFPELCCSQSVVTTRPQGDGGLNPLVSPTPGWSQMRIRLGPKGCMLPKDKVIVLNLVQIFLGKNPTIADPWTINTLPFQAGVAIAVNIRFFTSSEPHPVNVARLGEPRHPQLNGVTVTPNAAGTNLALVNVAGGTGVTRLFLDIVAWSSYVVGFSVVKDFSAVPSTTRTGSAPEVTFKFTLQTSRISNRTSASPNAVVISSNQGVFKPNTGTLAIPNQVLAGTIPSQCQAVRWFVNAYGTLIILLNPLFDVKSIPDSAAACSAALIENAVISVVIPSAAFLPNIAAGQWVYFDIRMVDPFMDNHLRLFQFYPTGGWTTPHIQSVDTATLMHKEGWFTTIDCTANGLSYSPTTLTDIRARDVSERCELLCVIASISPVTGGIFQCPNAAAAANANFMVTFVKVPEAAFYGQNWPWSYTANSPYPTPVSIPNTAEVKITNFGWIIDSPMFAIIVSYPPVSRSLLALGITPSVPSSYTLLLVIRLDRLTESCQVLFNNPWEFLVITNKNIVQCLFFPADGSNLAGVALEYVTWGARHFWVPSDGVVVCWTAVVGSPTPDDDSDDALFGLLALIAIPVLLCCCLLALLWFLRPKREPVAMAEYPVQETYWVNAQQTAPVYMVEQVMAPVTTPIPAGPMYMVQ